VVDTSPSGILSWLYAFGSEPVTAGGDYRFDTRASRNALAFLKDLYDSGCAWIPQSDIPLAEFAGRQALFATGSLADLDLQRQAFEQAGNQDDWTVIPFPSSQDEPVIDVYGPSFILLPGSQVRQLAAWLFVRWLADPQQNAWLVQASGMFPVRAGAQDELDGYAGAHPQWNQALALLPYARTEPALASWNTVRWVVGDVGTQVFRSYFTPDRIPATLELMDSTAAELHDRTP
jgi:ABC-type glycerol-3-phosphate transport system substrate-binding protein